MYLFSLYDKIKILLEFYFIIIGTKINQIELLFQNSYFMLSRVNYAFMYLKIL